ncbi:MAG: xanthine dehydrogenase family protein molybdopterin-binding subunit, partial [Acidimicrobiales bacterium]
MGVAGSRVTRREDERFLRGRGTYVENLPLPGALWATYVRSPVASAMVASMDVDAARRAPGVVEVVTAADLALAPFPPVLAISNQAMVRPWLADERVRFVGEPLAVVLSGTRAEGADAAELVVVGYERLPVVVDPEAALAPGSPRLFPGVGTNVALDLQFGTDGALFDGCEVVVRQRLVHPRLAHCPLEGRSAAAAWGDDGRLTHWSSSQSAHAVRRWVARLLGVDEAQVRVVVPDVGGAFGSKMDPTPEEVLLGLLARRAGRPVRWTETRSESMVSLGHGRGQVQHVEMGGTRAGRIQAYRLGVVQDAGAYPALATGLPVLTRSMLTGVYDIARAEFNSTSVVTNTAPMIAYRGAGRPEATAAVERALDLFAAEIGRDPAEVRRANLVPAGAFPWTNPVGTVYDSGDYQTALDRAVEAADYAGLRAEQARRRAAGDTVVPGIGLSMYVEVTAGAAAPDEWGAVAVTGDGRAVVRTGSSPHGQGHETGFAMLVADTLSLAVEDVDVVFGDTDVVASGEGTMGSRSLQTGGVAVVRAAAQVLAQAR